MSTRPSDYRPPPNSPHTRINLPQPWSMTPSGVPQYESQSVFVPRLPNSLDNTEEGNLPESICNIPKEYYWYKINKIRNFIKFHIDYELFPKNTGNFKTLTNKIHKSRNPWFHKNWNKSQRLLPDLHNILKNKIVNVYIYIYKISHASPRSESKHLLAHLSHHLLPDNKLSDHRYTHT